MFRINCKELSPLFKEVLHSMEENTRPSQTLSVTKMSKKKKKLLIYWPLQYLKLEHLNREVK